MTYRRLLVATAALGLAATMAGEATAKTLRFAEFQPNRGIRAEALKWFAAELEKRTGGSLKIEFHWGKSLLSTKAVLQGIGAGVADMGSIVGFFTPKKLRGYNIGDLPVKNSNEWVGMRALYELATTHPALKKEFDKVNVHYITNYTTGPIQLICTKKINALADLKGVKTRASGPYGKTLVDVGAVVQRMAQPKVYQALDSGLVTCNQGYYYSVRTYKQYEVASYMTELDWGQNMSFGVIMNKKSWNGLTAKEKQVLAKLGSDFIDHMARLMIQSKNADKAKMMKGIDGKKIVVNRLPEAERAKLIKASRKYVDVWVAAATKQGYDGKGIMAAYERHIAKYAGILASKGYPWK